MTTAEIERRDLEERERLLVNRIAVIRTQLGTRPRSERAWRASALAAKDSAEAELRDVRVRLRHAARDVDAEVRRKERVLLDRAAVWLGQRAAALASTGEALDPEGAALLDDLRERTGAGC